MSDSLLLIIGLVGLLLIGGALYVLTKAPSRKMEGDGQGSGGGGRRRERGEDDDDDLPDFDLTEKELKELDALKNKPKKRKKYLAKLEKKHKKAAQREQIQEQNEEKQTKRSAYEERQFIKEQEREETERKREEEAKKLQEIADAKAEEEFDDWKDMFETTDEGTDKLSSEETGNLLEKFVSYIERKKVVLLEDLATDFGITSSEAVDRVTALEANGAITGVVDDRGKFIYVSRDEMKRLADFVRRKGRVSISELVRESNSIIDLQEREEEEEEEEEGEGEREGEGEGEGEEKEQTKKGVEQNASSTVYQIEKIATERTDGLRRR